MGMKHKRLEIDAFPIAFSLLAGPWDTKAVNRLLKLPHGVPGIPDEEAPGAGQAGMAWDYDGLQVIWVRQEPKQKVDNQLRSTVVHEVVHGVLNVGLMIGFNDVQASSEFYCYMTDHVVKEFLDLIDKK